MRRRATNVLLATTIATVMLGASASAQILGMTTIEPELIDPGAVPRQELRYRLVEGQTGSMVMDMTMDITSSTDGIPADGAEGSLTMSATIDTTVTDVYEDGSARIEQTFARYAFGDSGEGLADAELEAVTDLLEGITVWQHIDDRGAVLDLGADAFDVLSPEIRQQVLDSTVSVQPFPEEAVGVGGRWVSSGSMDSQGLPMSMSVSTEVRELTADGAVLDVSISADADAAASLLGDMPPGVDVSVDRLAMDGGGTVAVAFGSLIPRSQVDMEMDMAMSVQAGEGEDAFASSMALGLLMGMEVYPAE